MRPSADQLTSTFTSAQLAYRYGFPILQEKSNRRACAVLHQCRALMLPSTAALLADGGSLANGSHECNWLKHDRVTYMEALLPC